MKPEPAPRRDRIYLTGFMGSGKSTIGPILANTIGYDFIDLDRAIEAAEGVSVSRIFREKGEEYFRDREREFLTRMSSASKMVISLGGGTLSDAGSLRIIKASGILVYLKLTQEQLYGRLRNKADRPMLMDDQGNKLSEEQLRARIQTLHEAREPLYAQADITVLTDGKRVGITVDQVVKRLSFYLR